MDSSKLGKINLIPFFLLLVGFILGLIVGGLIW